VAHRARTVALPLAAAAAITAASLTAAIPVSADAAGKADRGRPAQIELAATPGQVDVVALPCLPSKLTLSMTNTGTEDAYADAVLSADQPLTLSRSVFSSWLPAADPDVPADTTVSVRAPREAAPGMYEIQAEAGRADLTVPVRVMPLPPKGEGDNLALGEQATASSTHGSFNVCGAVDGDADSANWSTSTGWNDATRGTFPDTYDVQLAERAEISRVELYSLDSARYPAAKNALRDWDVQVLADGQWHTVDEVRGNTQGHVTSTFTPVQAEAVRIVALASNDAAYSRIVELQIFTQ
jgi:hypothetical protein